MASDKRGPGPKPKRSRKRGAAAVREASGLIEAQGRLERFSLKEKVSFLQHPEKHSAAERNALTLAYARQAEELGMSAANLLSEAAAAERDVRRFEERTGKTLEWMRFQRIIETARSLKAEHAAIKKEARAIARESKRGPFFLGRNLKERLSETQSHRESLAAREASNEERRKKFEEGWNALGGECKALYVLPEILRHVPGALACWRVRFALRCLRMTRLLYRKEDLPSELRKLLDDVGNKVAHPKEYSPWKPTEREREILDVWSWRASLTPDEKATEAKALGLGKKNDTQDSGEKAWDVLKSSAVRSIARYRVKERRPKRPAR